MFILLHSPLSLRESESVDVLHSTCWACVRVRSGNSSIVWGGVILGSGHRERGGGERVREGTKNRREGGAQAAKRERVCVTCFGNGLLQDVAVTV